MNTPEHYSVTHFREMEMRVEAEAEARRGYVFDRTLDPAVEARLAAFPTGLDPSP